MKIKLQPRNDRGTWYEILKDGKEVAGKNGLASYIFFDDVNGYYQCRVFINTKYISSIDIPAIKGDEKAMLKLVMPIIRKVLEMSD